MCVCVCVCVEGGSACVRSEGHEFVSMFRLYQCG